MARVMMSESASGAIVAHTMKAMTTATEHTKTFPTRLECGAASGAAGESAVSSADPAPPAGGGSSDPLEEADAVERSEPPAVPLAGSGVGEFSIVIVVSGLTAASVAGMSNRRFSGWDRADYTTGPANWVVRGAVRLTSLCARRRIATCMSAETAECESSRGGVLTLPGPADRSSCRRCAELCGERWTLARSVGEGQQLLRGRGG